MALNVCIVNVFSQFILRDSHPVQLQSCHCTCVAGTALCTHIAALLYQTAHYSQLRITAVPPVHSCTETEQQSRKPRTMVGGIYFSIVLWFYLWVIYVDVHDKTWIVIQAVKRGQVNNMVVQSVRPRERRLAEGIRLFILHPLIININVNFCIISHISQLFVHFFDSWLF